MTSPVALRVLAGLGDALPKAAGPQLLDLIEALTAPASDVDARLEESESGWARVFDLASTPDPAWLGAAIGSPVPGGITVDEQRAHVRDRAYWRRGTPGAVVAAARTVLTGTKRVNLLERTGSPWNLTVQVYTHESVGVTAEQIRQAVASVKPVGITVDVEYLEGATYEHLAEVHGTYEDVAEHFGTYDAPTDDNTISYHVPEEGTEA